MQRIKQIVLGLLGLIALIVVVGFFLPSEFAIARSTVINAPPERIFAQLDDPRAWKHWTVWNQRDPQMQLSYSGPARGLNAGWQWRSASEGNGEMVFTSIDPNRQLDYTLSFPDMGMRSSGVLRLEASGSGTRLTWTNAGDMGMNPINRYFGLFMDQLVGPDFEAGLANLKRRVEQG
ncbi:SRPBCC family protein [Chitinimonas taiwanensis]|uniref:SRPBCC family protein n=1 Tax=Chitinimonas taiwanensis TaxID=240412 RepID=UPI001617C905